MSEFLARSIADRLHHRGAYMAPQYADPAGAMRLLGKDGPAHFGSSLLADLRDVASADPAAQAAAYEQRKLEIASNYGFRQQEQTRKPFVFQDGVAVIPVHGLLINRFSSSYGFITGYNFIRAQLRAALEDSDVETVAFDINSFGGSAAGCAELSEEIFESRKVKPSVAVVDAFCYSAAYFVGSAASKMICTPTGGVGSIGCVMTHASYEKALKDFGVEITFIFAGDHKVDGNPYQKLSAEVKADLKRDVDASYEIFVQGVARNRGLTAEKVRGTQARCYSAIDAKQLKLIDAVEVPSKAVAMFLGELASEDPDDEDETEMTVQTENTPKQTAPVQQPQQAAPAAPAATGMTQEQVNAAVAAGIKADRERASGIKSLEEAKGRETLAAHLADAGYSVEAAKGILAAAPKAAEQQGQPQGAGQSRFHTSMDNSPQPNVGAGVGEPEGGDKKPNRGASMAAAFFGKRPSA
jgi:signal peptide peptidase SppA